MKQHTAQIRKTNSRLLFSKLLKPPGSRFIVVRLKSLTVGITDRAYTNRKYRLRLPVFSALVCTGFDGMCCVLPFNVS